MEHKVLRRNPDLLLEWDAQGALWVASREAGIRMRLPSHAVVLLDAFDGERALAQVVAHLASNPDEAEEILGVVLSLHRRNILVDESFESAYFQNYRIDDHHGMLGDAPRMETFRDALREVVSPGDVVADLGTGTGILALFACQAGAKKVYAIEGSPWIDVAHEMMAINGCEDRVELIRGRFETVEIPEPVDVIVSEWMDAFLVDGRMLPNVLQFRDRYLKEGGRMIPSEGAMVLVPVHAPEIHEDWISVWSAMKGLYDVDFSPMERLAMAQTHRRLVAADAMCASPAEVYRMDLHTVEARIPAFEADVEFTLEDDRPIHGFAGYFETPLSPGVTLSNSPSERTTHWRQQFFPMEVLEGRRGDTLACHVEVGPAVGSIRRLSATIDYTHRRGDTPLQERRAAFSEF